jgi:hypothetical protein
MHSGTVVREMSRFSGRTVQGSNPLFLMTVGGLFGKLFGKGDKGSQKVIENVMADQFKERRGAFAPAVMTAYSHIAASFAGKGQPQNGVETPRQYISRIIGSFDINKDALYELIGTAELARYGDPVIGERERDRALGAQRLVQQSLDGAGTPAPPAAPAASSRFPPQGFRPWVVAPVPLNPTPYATMPPDQVFRKVERSQADVDALSAAFRTSQLPIGAKLPDDMTEFMRDSIRTEDWLGLDGFVRKAIAGPAANWRVHVEHELCTYLVEMGCRMAETRLLLDAPTRVAHELTLRAAGALAIAEGRDFVICDDIKLAVLALQVYNYKLNFGDANKALDIMPVPF